MRYIQELEETAACSSGFPQGLVDFYGSLTAATCLVRKAAKRRSILARDRRGFENGQRIPDGGRLSDDRIALFLHVLGVIACWRGAGHDADASPPSRRDGRAGRGVSHHERVSRNLIGRGVLVVVTGFGLSHLT